MAYFSTLGNWSLPWLLGLGSIGVAQLLFFNINRMQKILFFVALFLLFIVFGSPVTTLTDFGLHSVTMFRHILMLMVIPFFVLRSWPSDRFGTSKLDFSNRKNKTQWNYVCLWMVGAIAMWGGHFLTSAILSSKTGLVICGVSITAGGWMSAIPQNLILGLLLLAGLCFALPVFHPDPSKRLAPLKSIIYLFTACVSCSVLGLYVAFSASSASMLEAVPVFTTLRNPFPMTLRADQEIAGMLMWVPGCILYVAASVSILLNWYEHDTQVENPGNDTTRNPRFEENNWIYMNSERNDR